MRISSIPQVCLLFFLALANASVEARPILLFPTLPGRCVRVRQL